MNFKQAVNHTKFIAKKPGVALRIARGFYKKLILKKSVLRTIDFGVSSVCNLQCKFCSAHLLYKPENKILSVEEIRKVWNDALSLGVIHVNLTGAEPLCRPFNEIVDIVKIFNQKNNIMVSMVSNCELLSFEKLKQLRKAGLDTLQPSCESITSEVHDSLRKKGNLGKVMQAMKWAKELDMNVCLSSVVYRENLEEIKKIIQFATKNDIFVVLNPLSAAGRWKDKSNLKLIEEDRQMFLDLMKFPAARADTILNFSGRQGCPGGTERVHITAYGDVLTCPLVQISYGNVKDESLRKIYFRMQKYPHLSKYSRLCKHAWDREYYENFCRPLESRTDVPVRIEEILKENNLIKNQK